MDSVTESVGSRSRVDDVASLRHDFSARVCGTVNCCYHFSALPSLGHNRGCVAPHDRVNIQLPYHDAPPPPSFKTIVVDVDRETRVGTLRLNRPRKSNALDPDMWREIPLALDWLDSDSDVRVVLLSGAGKNFCAGIDVSSPELLGQQLGETSDNGRRTHQKAGKFN